MPPQGAAQHLAALAEGGGRDPLQRPQIGQPTVGRPRRSCTTDEVTLGGGTKAEGATSNRRWTVQTCWASTESRP